MSKINKIHKNGNVMTSIYLRKLREVIFPCRSTLNRLAKITNVKDLGQFYLDMVWITLDRPWRVEDIIGKDLGLEPCFAESETGKVRTGTLHYRELNGQRFQIFRGRGRNRNIQINPRHFNSLEEFIAFVRLILGGRSYHITHIEFSWQLYKSIFSIAFLFWSLWVKNLKLVKRYDYKTDGLRVLEKGSDQGFCYGKKMKRVKAYDTDDFNTLSKRKEEYKVHGCINLEIGLDQKILKRHGIRKLADLRNVIDFAFVLNRLNFIKPSCGRFRNTKFGSLQEMWIEKGATAICRQLYKQAKTNDYTVLGKYLSPLRIKEISFKKALLELAAHDYEKFKKGISQEHRKLVRCAQADMIPLFKKPIAQQSTHKTEKELL